MGKETHRSMGTIQDLIGTLKGEKYVFIQTHDFPDHDAVGSAFGLQHFFRRQGIESHLVYDMEIQRDSLKAVIRDLGIPLKHIREYEMAPRDKIILVDGCKGNKNVKDLIGDEVAVIDHHLSVSPEDVAFSDIRSDYGACASIIASYYFEANMRIPRDVATALMIGIGLDTSFFTRGVSAHDLAAYARCFEVADTAYVNNILRNNIQIDDLAYYRYLLNHLECTGRAAFCYFRDGCDQNLMGILANFILTLDGIDFVILCAKNKNTVNFSLRSEVDEWDAARIIQEILEGVGFGGGHAEMAGGVIPDSTLFDKDNIYNRALSVLGILLP